MYIGLTRDSSSNRIIDIAHVHAKIVLRSTDPQSADDAVRLVLVQCLIALAPAEGDRIWVGGGQAGQQDVPIVLCLSDGALGFVCTKKSSLKNKNLASYFYDCV